MNSSVKILAAVIIVAVIGGGSYYALSNNMSGSSGTMKVYAQDAPLLNVSAVYMTFTNVSVHGNQTGWQNFSTGAETVNILGVTSSNATLLKGVSLTAQKYTVIRLYISRVTVDVNGVNVTFHLSAPFAFINHPFNVSAGGTTSIHFEFNLKSDLNLNSQVFTPDVGFSIQ